MCIMGTRISPEHTQGIQDVGRMKNCFFSLDFFLVAKESECHADHIYKGEFHSLVDCAQACRGEADMFAYGSYARREKNCFHDAGAYSEIGCSCECQSREHTSGGNCKDRLHTRILDLYAFSAGTRNRSTMLFTCLALLLIFKVLN